MHESAKGVVGIAVDPTEKSFKVTKLAKEDISIIQGKISKEDIQALSEKCSLHMCEAIWDIEGKKYQSFTALSSNANWDDVEFYMVEGNLDE